LLSACKPAVDRPPTVETADLGFRCKPCAVVQQINHSRKKAGAQAGQLSYPSSAALLSPNRAAQTTRLPDGAEMRRGGVGRNSATASISRTRCCCCPSYARSILPHVMGHMTWTVPPFQVATWNRGISKIALCHVLQAAARRRTGLLADWAQTHAWICVGPAATASVRTGHTETLGQQTGPELTGTPGCRPAAVCTTSHDTADWRAVPAAAPLPAASFAASVKQPQLQQPAASLHLLLLAHALGLSWPGRGSLCIHSSYSPCPAVNVSGQRVD
jgi:hypothetical protein